MTSCGCGTHPSSLARERAWFHPIGETKLDGPRRANVAHIRQSRPDSGLGLHAKVLTALYGVPASVGSGQSSKHPGSIQRPLPTNPFSTPPATRSVWGISTEGGTSPPRLSPKRFLGMGYGGWGSGSRSRFYPAVHPSPVRSTHSPRPLPSEYGTYKSVEARCWPWRPG